MCSLNNLYNVFDTGFLYQELICTQKKQNKQLFTKTFKIIFMNLLLHISWSTFPSKFRPSSIRIHNGAPYLTTIISTRALDMVVAPWLYKGTVLTNFKNLSILVRMYSCLRLLLIFHTALDATAFFSAADHAGTCYNGGTFYNTVSHPLTSPSNGCAVTLAI